MPTPITDLSRLSIHTITTKPWTLEQCIAGYQRVGVNGITVWRQHLQGVGAAKAGQLLRSAGMTVTALCRGGFFPARDAASRQAALDDNRTAIDQAAAIGAPMLVLVCGAVPGMPLDEARAQIQDSIAALEGAARAAQVRLAIEPLHPMYAGDRSAITTMRQARAVCDAVASPWVGIAVDVYHVWWDDALASEIALSGSRGYLHGFHVCDWRLHTRDLLNDRGLMGEGCIDVPRIRGLVEDAGFTGWNEVEIFSNERWAGDQERFVDEIVAAYRRHV